MGIIGRVGERSLVVQKVDQVWGCGLAFCHVEGIVTSDRCAGRWGEFSKLRSLVGRWGGDRRAIGWCLRLDGEGEASGF